MSGVRILLACAVVAGCAKGREVGTDPDASDDPDGTPGVIDADRGPDADQTPDAMGAPDANQTPDANTTPDAATCTVQTVQILVNPNLDANPIGTGWDQFPFDPGYPLITPPPTGLAPVNPPNVAWLGGFLSASDRMYQDIAIPASATALELRGSRLIGTEETGGVFDHVYLEIYSPGDALLSTLVHWTNADMNATWATYVLPAASAYAGQTIRVSLRSTTDFSLNTNFFFDPIRLFVTACL